MAANSYLRQRSIDLANEFQINALIPEKSMCTDNAAMIAVAGKIRYQLDGASGIDTGTNPGWKLSDL